MEKSVSILRLGGKLRLIVFALSCNVILVDIVGICEIYSKYLKKEDGFVECFWGSNGGDRIT